MNCLAEGNKLPNVLRTDSAREGVRRGAPLARQFIASGMSAFVLLCAISAGAQTARPRIRAVEPPGGQRGKSVKATIYGMNLGYGTALVFDDPGITVESVVPDAPPAGAKNPDAKLAATLKIPESMRPGRHDFRVVTPFGASEHGFFTVGFWPEAGETEPNNARDKAQALVGPVTVEAKSDASEDVDWFKTTGKPGDDLVFVASATECFGSPMEPVLTLFDEAGNEVGSASALTRPEARLNFTVRKPGAYFLRVRDLRYAGSADHRYRLSAGRLPVISSVWPLGGTAGSRVSLSLFGVNLPVASMGLSLPAVAGTWDAPLLSSLTTLDVTHTPSLPEVEPNDAKETATELSIPMTADGRIERRGDLDYYRFSATKGQALELEVLAARLGSKLDGVLTVFAADGRELAASDDGRGKDPFLVLTAPETGEYLVRVTDLNERGGSGFGYRLRVALATPDFSLAFAPDCLALGPGDRVPVTVTATRKYGFNDEIGLELNGLPPGVSLVGPMKIPAGQSEVTLLAVVAPDAKPAVLPLSLTGRASVGVRTAASLQEDWTKTPEGILVRVTRPVPLALAAVTGPPDLTVNVSAETLDLKVGGTVELTVKLARKPGFTAKVPLIFTGLPAGVSASPLEVPENVSELKVTLKAEPTAAPGESKLLLVARSVVDELHFSPHAAPFLTLRVGK